MKTAIITIGDEILIGQIVDSNSAWIANKMTASGFEIEEMSSIGDNSQQIKDTITDIFQRVDVILTTGGLGPTKDDITKHTLCEYFGTELIFDQSVLDNIEEMFRNRLPVNELTRNQAYVPKDCTVIQNKVGTAPITWFERNGKVLVSMPGVPYEMKYNMENEVVPRLLKKYKNEAYVSKVFIVEGYSESALAMYLTDFENNLPEGFGLAYLPDFRMMKLRLYVKGEHRRTEFNEQVDILENLLGESIISEEDEPVQKLLGKILLENNLTLGTAESCTGGNIAHLITSIPGASQYFKGSIVSYSNSVKSNILKVSTSNIEKDGAVSESVVTEMAIGAQKTLETNCAIAVSGIAGPDGGTDEKPVGTVWIATTVNSKTIAKRYQLGRYREANIMGASNIAMFQLINMIVDQKK
ncbi:CinA family nicotinamide mononucleotide deamidase-related protein [Dysgonomonas sp. 216]|uniref:CinA family nicotinamide mononucleotide deamidase-related protein n=1 Tax=Dysgonomonas sp. 216 TaxID=2302934 RepID=UPI0013D4F0B1|nr:CinA family nicotinamide mononucleotide deamidase-related protein [Dysgonomonas sp. 216]NDW19364.1 CinA family nicotinamide mononucleotide deamidase-related protein [Dysgonomonas sp. 216]